MSPYLTQLQVTRNVYFTSHFNLLTFFLYTKIYQGTSGKRTRPASSPLLIAQSILPAAVRALPGYPVTRHSPEIFKHAGLANTESAFASPAKKWISATANAVYFFCFSAFFPVCHFVCRVLHVMDKIAKQMTLFNIKKRPGV